MKRLVLAITAFFICKFSPAPAQMASSSVGAPQPKVLLVELFTSEGCSSCPPADALLRQINGTQAQPGELIVGISEHVTYWNSLGWRDPFSSSAYTDRQNLYGTRFRLDSVYTPQMVVNGAEQFVGSDRVSLAAAFRKEQDHSSSVALRILSSSVDGKSLLVRFSAAGDASTQGADIVAVLTDDVAQSNVQGGENGGRTLSHVAVARSLQRVATLATTADQTVRLPLPSPWRANSGHHLILFAQAPNSGPVLGTDSKPL